MNSSGACFLVEGAPRACCGFQAPTHRRTPLHGRAYLDCTLLVVKRGRHTHSPGEPMYPLRNPKVSAPEFHGDSLAAPGGQGVAAVDELTALGEAGPILRTDVALEGAGALDPLARGEPHTIREVVALRRDHLGGLGGGDGDGLRGLNGSGLSRGRRLGLGLGQLLERRGDGVAVLGDEHRDAEHEREGSQDGDGDERVPLAAGALVGVDRGCGHGRGHLMDRHRSRRGVERRGREARRRTRDGSVTGDRRCGGDLHGHRRRHGGRRGGRIGGREGEEGVGREGRIGRRGGNVEVGRGERYGLGLSEQRVDVDLLAGGRRGRRSRSRGV